MQQEDVQFGFNDLHSFKDFVVFAQTSLATGRFRQDNGPWSPELAFRGLRHGLELAAAEGVPAEVIAECAGLVASAENHFQASNVREGFFALERLNGILKRIATC